uniref:Uncharacterized protein n=1 Tax=Anguilla anguilla TaxID=7936 RepID=A0A0E9W5Q2_ANGAN
MAKYSSLVYRAMRYLFLESALLFTVKHW